MKRYVLSLLVAFSYFSVQAINPLLLKGMPGIDKVPADYSPVMGLSFLEWGIAEQWYKLSSKFQNKQLAELLEQNPQALSDNPELAKIVQEMKFKNNSATENLVMEMYHIVRGSFKRTNAPDNPVRQLKPRHIGEILNIIQDGMSQLKDMNSLLAKQAAEKGAIMRELAALANENSIISGLISKAQVAMKTETDSVKKTELEIQIALYLTQIAELKLQKKTLQDSLTLAANKDSQEYLYGKMKSNLLMMLNGLGFKNDKGKVLKWNSFVEAIVGSLKESTGEGRLYAENTAQDLLLSYLLIKSDTRDDLQEYFRGFLGDDLFVLSPEEYSSQDIEQILAAKTDAADFEKFADLLSAYTYKEKYNSSFPKVVDKKEATFKGRYFADCMETTMRMLANIVTYRPNLSKVGVVPEGLDLNPAVKDFYDSEHGLCAQSAEVGNSKVHQAWAQVIENRPGCIYAKIGTEPTDFMDVSNICDGVMPTGAVFTTTTEGKIEIDGVLYEPYSLQVGTKTYTLAQKKVGNATYLLVPKDSELVCCEMMPNNLNVVTGLDYIFNLGLYTNISQLFEPDFVSKNFKTICEKFGWNPQVDLADLDKLGSIDIPIKTEAGKFSIHLAYNHHGYVTVENKAKIRVELDVPSTTTEQIAAAIVGAGLKKVKNLPQELQAACLDRDVAVLNYDQRFDALTQMLQDKNSFSEGEKAYIQSLIISFSFVQDTTYLKRLVGKFGSNLEKADFGDFVVGALQLHDVVHKSNITLDLLQSLIDAKLITINRAVSLIVDSMSSKSKSFVAFTEMVKLITKDLITSSDQVSKLLPFIKKGIEGLDFSTWYALDAMNGLITKDLITYEQVSQLLRLIIQRFSETSIISRENLVNVLFCNYTIKLVKTLVDKKMITRSEVEAIKNAVAINFTEFEKGQLVHFKLKAPLSIQGKEVETKMKAKAKLSEKQKREIIEIAKRTKKQRLMEVRQEQLRQEEEQRQIAHEQHLAQHHEVEPQHEQ